MTKKYIIGLGCSWTQGEGGYTDEVWKSHNGRVQIRFKSDYYLRQMEHENSWVNVLCRDYFPEYTPMNLGVKGIGNTAAVKQLYFCDKIDWENSTGIIVLMMSGFERFNVFQQNPCSDGKEEDYYSNNEYRHYKWRTSWPALDSNDKLNEVYARELWSERFTCANQMMALLELQTFAKAYNFQLVIANAFNQRNEGIIPYLKEHAGSLVTKFNWDTYIHNTTEFTAFVQKLVELDGLIPPDHWGGFHQYYSKRNWPAKYLTNCEGAHPTIEGYKVIGAELAKFIKLRGHA